jgi:hypothetical protein
MSEVLIPARPERFPPIVPSWETLDQALARVMAVRGTSVEETQTLICQVIADRRVEVSVVTDRHETKQRSGKHQLSGGDLEIPLHLKPSHFDWNRSRPVKAWGVKPGRLPVEGRWLMRSIMVRGEDVTRVLCTPVADSSIAPVDETAGARRHVGNNLAQTKPRGPRPTVRKRVEAAMQTDLALGKLTVETLADMKEEALAARYGASREPARKARANILSELDPRQNPTSNK